MLQNQNLLTKEENNLSKVQNISISLINSISTVALYAAGVNLSKESPYGKVVFLSTVALTFIYPRAFNGATTYILKKRNEKKKIKIIDNNRRNIV